MMTRKDWKPIWLYFEAVIEYMNTYKTSAKLPWHSKHKDSESSVLRNVLHIHFHYFTDEEWNKLVREYTKDFNDRLIAPDWDTQKKWIEKKLTALVKDRV